MSALYSIATRAIDLNVDAGRPKKLTKTPDEPASWSPSIARLPPRSSTEIMVPPPPRFDIGRCPVNLRNLSNQRLRYGLSRSRATSPILKPNSPKIETAISQLPKCPERTITGRPEQ